MNVYNNMVAGYGNVKLSKDEAPDALVGLANAAIRARVANYEVEEFSPYRQEPDFSDIERNINSGGFSATQQAELAGSIAAAKVEITRMRAQIAFTMIATGVSNPVEKEKKEQETKNKMQQQIVQNMYSQQSALGAQASASIENSYTAYEKARNDQMNAYKLIKPW
jgi:hypothetical protein